MTTHWTQMLSLLGLQPFHDAMDVETVRTSTPDKWAIVSGAFAIWTTTIKGHPKILEILEKFLKLRQKISSNRRSRF